MPELTQRQKRKLLKFFEPSIKQHPDWPVIVSEGDSWFSFPIHFNVIDHLDEMARHRFSLLRLEEDGETALRIVGGRQKAQLAAYLKRYPVNALLFSGGGNDIVGQDLLPLLKQRQPGMSWRECINDETTGARFDRIRSAYLDIIHLRDENRPGCKIYLHGYDFAIPSGKGAVMWGIKAGPWMKPYLEAKGIKVAEDQRKIIHHLITLFGEMLAGVAQKPDIVLVDTPNTLTDQEWNDELHPTRKGFEKIAAKFREELNKQFPATF